MKNLLKLAVAAMALTVFSFNANAQFNAGIDIALPLGDFGDAASFGFGVSAGYEHKLGDNMGVGGEVGYLLFSGKDPEISGFMDYSSSYSMIPILAHFKYYFTENTSGAYGKVALGMSQYSAKIEYTYETITGFDSNFNPIYGTESISSSASEMYLTYGFGAGFLVNESIDIAAEYRIVSGDGGSLGYINIGAAYNF